MSTLKADTIVASDGSSPVTLTKQSAAKAYFSYEMDSPSSIKKSLNASSLTDNGTGDATLTVTNAMSDADYASAIEVGDAATTDQALITITGTDYNTPRTTTIYRGVSHYVSSTHNRTAYDTTYNSVTHFGDLA
jgi:hypothetical protein